ncbi:MAG: ATP-dependent Clp protease ATP-binding subunit [Chloroflexi bacterium]|nr:MAG: ATP-dependent Clp protease ATP-binding subunit [Chloroflexota bacterium]
MTSKRGTLSKKKITPELAQALAQAAELMRQMKQPVMTAEMLLLALVHTPAADAHRLLRHFSQVQNFGWQKFAGDVERAAAARLPARDENFDVVVGSSQRVPLGNDLLVVLDEGLSLAEAHAESRCSSVHALAVLANIQLSTHWLLNRRGITPRAVLNELTSMHTAKQAAGRQAETAAALPIFHRQGLEQKLVNLLSLRSERNVILIGEAGVGKRSLVLGVGQLMAAGRGPVGLKSVVELDEKQLLDDPLAALEQAIRRAQNGILFVPDIARFFGGIRADFREDVGNKLQMAFLLDSVVVVGTATEEAFNKKLKSARVVAEHSQILRVPPATVEESIKILNTVKPKFEKDYQLTIIEQSLEETARLAERYYTARPMPGAAVDLLHRACAMVKTGGRLGPDSPVKDDGRLNPDDVTRMASILTGIPVNSMQAEERSRYIDMEQQLHKRIIGQQQAISALSQAVKMARVGLKDPRRPIGSFLFLGPTGVGKSEMAKALAEFMFGTERALITLDMSEYMDASSVNRLIGSPPGYVGHESGGQLTDAVKKQPYSVVLFDEVEKADRKVFDTLLQVMDEGRLTSGQGETVSFTECVILMTSNIGGPHLADVRFTHTMPAAGNGDSLGEPAYNTENMRKLLNAGFSAAELRLIAETLMLPVSSEDVGENAGLAKPELIERVVAETGQKSQFDLLLETLEKLNPTKYNEFEPYFNWAVACRRAEAELKRHFRPEFLNRLDNIIYFHPLNNDHLRKILDLMLKKESKLVAGQGLKLQISDGAKRWLLSQNEHPEWGARPLRRLIQKHIRERLAEYLLQENPPPGATVKIQTRGGQLKIIQQRVKQ